MDEPPIHNKVDFYHLNFYFFTIFSQISILSKNVLALNYEQLFWQTTRKNCYNLDKKYFFHLVLQTHFVIKEIIHVHKSWKKILHIFSLEGKLTGNCNPTRFRAHIYNTIVGHCISAMLEWDEITKRFKTCRVSFYFYFCLAYFNQCFNVLNRKKAKYPSC